MTDDSAQVRREILAAHGLPEAASKFLQGDSVAGWEAQAAQLARLAGARAEEPQSQAVDPITASLQSRSERRRRLHSILTGPPRDEQGRFLARDVPSFDGGARPGPIQPPDPEREHGQLIGEMASVSRTFGTSLSTRNQ